METFVAQEEPKKKKKSQLKPSIKLTLSRAPDFKNKMAKLKLIEEQDDPKPFPFLAHERESQWEKVAPITFVNGDPSSHQNQDFPFSNDQSQPTQAIISSQQYSSEQHNNLAWYSEVSNKPSAEERFRESEQYEEEDGEEEDYEDEDFENREGNLVANSNPFTGMNFNYGNYSDNFHFHQAHASKGYSFN